MINSEEGKGKTNSSEDGNGLIFNSEEGLGPPLTPSFMQNNKVSNGKSKTTHFMFTWKPIFVHNDSSLSE